VFEALIAPIALAVIAVIAVAVALVVRLRRRVTSRAGDHDAASQADDRPRARRLG